MTPRQKQIAEMVAKGRLNKQIAYDLGISEATVKMHLSRLYGTLRIGGRNWRKVRADLKTIMTERTT